MSNHKHMKPQEEYKGRVIKNLSEEKEIIQESDIINTYNKKEQIQASLYKGYKEIKDKNPTFGYKRIAKVLNQPYHKTRWWHSKKRVPVSMQTVNWLKQKGLLPLTVDNPKLSLIAKILGTTFGDGGIFSTLNAIFLSSSEFEATQEFKKDLLELFGNEIEQNMELREGGEYGHSWAQWNTNRNVIRFFQALGAPIGDKSLIPLNFPKWIQLHKDVEDEFYGSFFGNELGVPKIHINKTYLDTLSIGITATEQFAENRTGLLKEVARYLNNKGIVTGTISINDHKKCNRKGEPTKVYRLLISTTFENVTNFMILTKMNYVIHKRKKIAETMNAFSSIKKQRLKDLIEMGYKKEGVLKWLKLTPAALELIENEIDFKNI